MRRAERAGDPAQMLIERGDGPCGRIEEALLMLTADHVAVLRPTREPPGGACGEQIHLEVPVDGPEAA